MVRVAPSHLFASILVILQTISTYLDRFLWRQGGGPSFKDGAVGEVWAETVTRDASNADGRRSRAKALGMRRLLRIETNAEGFIKGRIYRGDPLLWDVAFQELFTVYFGSSQAY